MKGNSLTQARSRGPGPRPAVPHTAADGNRLLSAHSSVEDSISHFLAFLGQTGKADHTIAAYRRDLGQFASFLHPRVSGATPTIPSLVPELVVEFTDRLVRQGLRRATVARKTSSLRSFFRFLCKRGFLQRNPASEIPPATGEPNTETAALDTGHIEAALRLVGTGNDFQSTRDRAVLEVLYGAGLRLEELVGLNLSALDFDQRALRVSSADKERPVPFGEAAQLALRSYLLARADQLVNTSIDRIDAGALFINKRGRRLHRRSIQRIVERHLAAAEVAIGETAVGTERWSHGPQALRRAFADHLVKAGADADAVREVLGQASLPALSPASESFEALRQRYDRAHPRAM